MNKFKPTIWDAVIMAAAILLAYALNALMDAIMVVKAPRGLDLEHLWHGSKYAWVGFVMIFAASAWRHIGWLIFDRGGQELKKERPVLLRFLVALIFSGVTGFFLWDVLYQEFKTIPWYDFPWA